MYKILFGIPAIPFTLSPNGDKCIEDRVVNSDDGEDIWCDFSLEYNMKYNYYYFNFETMLGFDSDDGCRNWIIHCLSELTEYMNRHGYSTSKELDMYEVFTKGVNVNTNFDSIEDAYAFMKLMVFGFHGKGLQ